MTKKIICIVSTVNNPDIWKSFKILVLIEGKMPQTCATMNYIRCVTHLITHQQFCVEPNSYSLLISLYLYIRQGKCQEENREWSCQTVAIKGPLGYLVKRLFPLCNELLYSSSMHFSPWYEYFTHSLDLYGMLIQCRLVPMASTLSVFLTALRFSFIPRG